MRRIRDSDVDALKKQIHVGAALEEFGELLE
jgi:hypothetical protein